MQFVRKRKGLLAIILMLGAFVYLPSITSTVHAATGTVCLIDPSSSSCPTNPASLTGTVGTQQRISVFVQGSNGMNGLDITVLADHTILKPAGVDLTGSVLTSQTQIIQECIGGAPMVGTACSSTDTVDTIHLSAATSGLITPTPTTGLLFTAIYNVTGSTSGIPVGFQTGCTSFPTSVPGGTCVTIENGSGTPVPETVQTATFTTPPTFTISASPTSLTIGRPSQGTSTITLQSLSGFSGTIQLSSSISPNGHHAPAVTLSASSVTLSSGGSGPDVLTVTTIKNTTVGTYTITVTATSGSIAKSTTITVTVTH